MTIFTRPWLAPSPAVVFDPLNIGIAFLVNIGYGGPIADDSTPGIRGMTCPSLHRWPPTGLSDSTPRRQVIQRVLASAQFLDHAALDDLSTSLDGLSSRVDDTIFRAEYDGQVDTPIEAGGVCLAPAMVPGDPIIELPGETIQIGDMAAIVLRGTLVPLGKVFAGVIDREGFPAALFYLKKPEQIIEVPLSDVLYARKIKAPREYNGHSLLADADSFVATWRERFHLADTMEPVGTSRTTAWVESMTSIFSVLRQSVN